MQYVLCRYDVEPSCVQCVDCERVSVLDIDAALAVGGDAARQVNPMDDHPMHGTLLHVNTRE